MVMSVSTRKECNAGSSPRKKNCMAQPAKVARNITAAVFLAASLAYLTGCQFSGTSDPSEKQARAAFTNSLQPLMNDGGEIIDFRKSNGESQVIKGQKWLLYHFHAAIKLPSGWVWHSYDGNIYSIISSDQEGGLEEENTIQPYSGGTYTRLPKGTIVAFRGIIEFRSTEKGWIHNPSLDDAQQGVCARQIPSECYKQFGWDVPRWGRPQ